MLGETEAEILGLIEGLTLTLILAEGLILGETEIETEGETL